MDTARGFTLIELLVVIAIIGILSGVVLASLSSARSKGQDAARMADIKSLKTALEMYANDYYGYPTTVGSGNSDAFLSDATLVSKLVPKYISVMPALLISDGDHYYTNGITTGVAPAYDILVYTSAGACRTGLLPGNTGDWGVPTLCNF